MDRIYEVYRLLCSKKIPLDVLVYTPEEIRERLALRDLFIEDIIENGKLIYEKNKLKLVQEWVQKAKEDEKVGLILIKEKGPWGAACFHFQ